MDSSFSRPTFSASANGIVLSQSLRDAVSEVVVHAVNGRGTERLPIENAQSVHLSRDGRMLAYGSTDPGGRRHVRVLDMERGVTTRLTDGGRENWPVLAHDGKTVAYTTEVGAESFSLDEVAADGSGSLRTLARGARMLATDYSPDGRFLLFMTFERGAPAVGIYDRVAGESVIWARGAEGHYSPDGKWIAWVIVGDVYVQAADGRGTRVQVSRDGGGSRIGAETVRVSSTSPDCKLMGVQLEVRDGEMVAAAPEPVLQTQVLAPWFRAFQ